MTRYKRKLGRHLHTNAPMEEFDGQDSMRKCVLLRVVAKSAKDKRSAGFCPSGPSLPSPGVPTIEFSREMR